MATRTDNEYVHPIVHRSRRTLSSDDMRRYVIPWHTRIAQVAHDAGKPAILHSCGNLAVLMDDIIDDIGYDGKHSYEDAIMPVEQAYDTYADRIAILGGLNLAAVPQIAFILRQILTVGPNQDLVCRLSPDSRLLPPDSQLRRGLTTSIPRGVSRYSQRKLVTEPTVRVA